MKRIERVEVGHINGSRETTACASWRDADSRYHFWFDLKTKEIDRRNGKKIIYKNSFGKEGERGYFNCRYMDADAAKNREVVVEVWKQIEANNLIALAIEAKARAKAEVDSVNREHARTEKIKEAGPRLLTALSELRAEISDYEGHGNPGCPRRVEAYLAMQQADLLLAELGEKK